MMSDVNVPFGPLEQFKVLRQFEKPDITSEQPLSGMYNEFSSQNIYLSAFLEI